jgi:hypothetical protein
MSQNFASLVELQVALSKLPADGLLPAVTLTPELAKEILEVGNELNRKIRAGNLERLKREITQGWWDPRKSPPICFIGNRLADGQHRARAVAETGKAVVVSVAVIGDTMGMDIGATRTLADDLTVLRKLSETDAGIASAVTRALCKVFAAGRRELLEFFISKEAFIMECVRVPQEWLAEQQPLLSRIFPPRQLSVVRARLIQEYGETPATVDQLLVDAINQGATAPADSIRFQVGKQLYLAMENAFKSKKAPTKNVVQWVLAGLHSEREGKVMNLLTARGTRKNRKKKAA